MKRILFITSVSLFFCLSSFAQTKQKAAASLSVKEGAAGVFLFTGNNPTGSSAQPGKVFRAEGNDRDFKQIGEVRPATTMEEFRALAGAGSLRSIAKLKGLATEQEA